MAKTPSDKLFRLVKSLTPAEKRYFRLFAGAKSDRNSKYLQLFDAIDAQQELQEAQLKKKIYKSQPLEGKKYSELKAYLYDLILKSLQQYDEGQSVSYRLNHLLQSVAVLFKRGQYEDCFELLNKAARLARTYERFTHQIEVIRWEKQLAYTRMDADFFHRELDRLQYEEGQMLLKADNASAYRRAFFSVYAAVKREALTQKQTRDTYLKSLLPEALFDSPDRALSHTARVSYYRALNLFQYATLDYTAFFESGEKLVALLESQPHFLKEDLGDYIAGLSNYILSAGLQQRYDIVRQTLEKLRNLKPITADDRLKIHRQYYTNYFVLCIYTGEFEAARTEMDHCQAEAQTLHLQDYETASFYFQYSVICFGCADYSGSLDYLNQWLSQPRTVEREDLQSLARILSLIMHYELGNTLLLESLIRSATRFLQKKNRLFDLEQRFIQLMTDLLKSGNKQQTSAAFVRTSNALDTLAQEPNARALLQTFDLQAWLQSKISDKPFAQIVREKWLEQKSL